MFHLFHPAVWVEEGVFSIQLPLPVMFRFFDLAGVIIGDVVAFQNVVPEGRFFSDLSVFVIGNSIAFPEA